MGHIQQFLFVDFFSFQFVYIDGNLHDVINMISSKLIFLVL